MPHKDPEERKRYMRKWSATQRANSQEFRDRQNQASKAAYRKRRAEHPEDVIAMKRDWQLRDAYGITLLEYQRMEEIQLGVCAICHKSCDSGRALAVDHCHISGQVRGLLCNNCNNGLGRFQDDPQMLRQAAEYLDGFN